MDLDHYQHALACILPANLKDELRSLFLEDVKSTFEVHDCVAEHGVVVCILQICQIVAAKLASCGPLADVCHLIVDNTVEKVRHSHTALPESTVDLRKW